VTVTLSNALVREIDLLEKNRSKFIAEAVRNELDRRPHGELHRSLDNPHPESPELAEPGLEEWTRDFSRGRCCGTRRQQRWHAIRWVSGVGWVGMSHRS
jgi:hypothetical protein